MPTLGLSWQVVQVPLMTGFASVSFSPPTPVIEIREVIEQVFAARDRLPVRLAAQIRPLVVDRKNIRVKRRAGWVAAKRIVNADMEGLRRKKYRTTFSTLSRENPAFSSLTCAVQGRLKNHNLRQLLGGRRICGHAPEWRRWPAGSGWRSSQSCPKSFTQSLGRPTSPR